MLTPGQCPSPPAATPLEPPTKQWPPAPRPKERYALTSTSSFPSTPRLNFFTKATEWKNQSGRTLADFRQYPSVSTTTEVSLPWAPSDVGPGQWRTSSTTTAGTFCCILLQLPRLCVRKPYYRQRVPHRYRLPSYVHTLRGRGS